jgi:integrase
MQLDIERKLARRARAQAAKGRLTNAFCRGAALAKGTEIIERDVALPGFILRIGKRTKSFAYRVERRRNGRRLKMLSFDLGQFPDITADQARTLAEAKRVEFKAGTLVDTSARASRTIDSVWPTFEVAPLRNGRKKSQETVDDYRRAKNRLGEDILHRPLRDLANDPTVMVDEIARIIKERSDGRAAGQAAGNATARFVRAIYRHAAKSDLSLPAGHPCRAVAIVDPENEQPVLAPREFPKWWSEVQALANPIRREAHFFAVLSNLRRNDLETLRWENLDVAGRKFRIVKPKGGARKAFDLILTRPMLRCLWRARRAGRMLHPELAETWVFPSGDSKSGHVKQLTKDAVSHANHALRRSYSSIATSAGVAEETVTRFLNHQSKSVAGINYIRTSAIGRFLSEEQAKISAAIIVALVPDPAKRRGLT